MSSSAISTQHASHSQPIVTNSLINYRYIARTQMVLEDVLKKLRAAQATNAYNIRGWQQKHTDFYNKFEAQIAADPIFQQRGFDISTLFKDGFTHLFMQTPISLSCCKNFFDATNKNRNEHLARNAYINNDQFWETYSKWALISKCLAHTLEMYVKYKHPTCLKCHAEIIPTVIEIDIYEDLILSDILKRFYENPEVLISKPFIQEVKGCMLRILKLQQARNKAEPVLTNLKKESCSLYEINFIKEQKREEIEQFSPNYSSPALTIDKKIITSNFPIPQELETAVDEEGVAVRNVLKSLQLRMLILIDEGIKYGNLDVLMRDFRILSSQYIMSRYPLPAIPVPVAQQPIPAVVLQSSMSQGQGASSGSYQGRPGSL